MSGMAERNRMDAKKMSPQVTSAHATHPIQYPKSI